jgi:hypothetical protein
MRFAPIAIGIALLAGMLGCSPREGLRSSTLAAPTSLEALLKIDDPIGCNEAGGQWGPRGLTGTPGCSVPLSDAGKICSDKTDCIGDCVASIDGDRYSGVQVKDIKPARGQCQAESALFGCFIEFRNGKRQPAICVD